MKLPSLPLVVLDTETTGFVPRVHKVIEFASAEVRDGKLKEEYEQLLHHDQVPPVVEVLTRIKTADITNKPSFDDKREEILAHLPEDALIVGQNVGFDIGMLKGEGIDLSNRPWIDTSMLASLVFPELESYSLGYLSTALNLNHNPPHRALGDVRATLELLGKCWERLMELPPDLRELTQAIITRGPVGYRMLFEELPKATKKTEPAWLAEEKEHKPIPGKAETMSLSLPSAKQPTLLDEPLDPLHLQSVIEAALKETSMRHWIAVKSLRPTLRRLPADLLSRVSVIYPPHSLIDVEAVLQFSKQETYTADEATLALKLAWYEPDRRDEFPLHGGEDSVWNGKLSSTANSKAYLQQFADLPHVVLLDHRELLEFLQNPEHPGAKSMGTAGHVIIDDASMLEDTATKAYGWYTAMDDVRAGSQGHPLLTKFADTLHLWVEKVRQFQDVRYLTSSDLTSADTKGLRSLLDDVLEHELSAQLRRHLENLKKILDPENLPHRIIWIEQKPNGNQSLQSVPERIGRLLHDSLFSRFPTTLLIPHGSSTFLPEILPANPAPESGNSQLATRNSLPISFSPHPNLDELLTNPPAGKTVILLPGRGAIEDLYVKYTEALEAKDVTMICQGVSGGMGRMQAEFLAAPAPALWLLTPWMYEGVDLPPGTVDHLVMKTLPFDHPSHPVLSRRSQHYRDPFGEYSLARLLHRLFRLLRTYGRIKTAAGDVRLLDDRIRTKGYGARVKEYLLQFGEEQATEATKGTDMTKTFQAKPLTSSHAATAEKPKKPSKPKKPKADQPSLF